MVLVRTARVPPLTRSYVSSRRVLRPYDVPLKVAPSGADRRSVADPEPPAAEPVAVAAAVGHGDVARAARAEVGADHGGAEVVELRGDDAALDPLGHRVDE